MPEKRKRGFAVMDREKQRQIASKGGRAAHQKGTAHEFTSEEAREAGRKGGLMAHQRNRSEGVTPTESAPEAAPEQETAPSTTSAVEHRSAGPETGGSSHSSELGGRNMNADHDHLVDVLNHLIETCNDRENGYRTAAAAIRDSALQARFQEYQQQSAEFARELSDEVRRWGADPMTGGSFAGWLMRGWMNLKSAVTGGDEGAIIAECERGENAAAHNYEHAMNQPMPVNVLGIVQRQYYQVKDAHDRIRSFELTQVS